MRSKEKTLSKELANLYMEVNGVKKVPSISLTANEAAANKKVPTNHKVLDTYFDKRTSFSPGVQLHSTMRFELFNFVDGKRSYYDIYKAIKAESLAAGNWYYGIPELDSVVKLLDANVESGALVLR